MHKLLPVLCAAALVGALFWILTRERTGRPPRASPPPVAPAEAPEAAELAAPAASSVAAEAGARAVLRPEGPPAPVAVPSAAPPRSRVFGLVTDQRGAPIEGAQATLHGMGRWVAEDVHLGAVPLTYSAAAGRDGRFVFDVLTPGSDWVSLMVAGGIYRGRAVRNFGLAGGRNQDPLRVGDNDLGTLVLEDAGAVTGRVTNAAGAPLAGVSITVEGSCPDGFNKWAETDQRGVYELWGLPGLRLSLGASGRGYLDLQRSGIDVQLGQTTPGVDFALGAAPSISGRAVGEDGAPLVGVQLWGWPVSRNGSGAGARSGEDGTFVVYLPQDEPYTLGAELTGYEQLTNESSPVFAPGTRDIELVLKRPALHAFRVRDALTRAPVERFGMKLIQVRTADGGSRSSGDDSEPAPLADHPGGVVELAGDPALCDYTIEAPGYGSQRARVALDADGGQVIALRPEASLAGRLVQAGLPVPDALVRVVADDLPIDSQQSPDPEDPFDWRQDLDEFTGRTRLERGGADGSFRVGGLAPGTYELVLSGTDTAPLKLERLALKAGEARDLGELEVGGPGEIAGVALLPADVPRGGLRVVLDGGFFYEPDDAQVTDGTGAFRFGGLAAGLHKLYVMEKPGTVLGGPVFPVELAPGEHRRVELDLARRVPCRVTVRASLDGAALDGVHAVVLRSDPALDVDPILELDAEGQAEGFIAGGEIQGFELRGPCELTLAADTRARRLQPGEAVDVEFEAAAGSLRAWLPADGTEQPMILVGLRRAGEGDDAWKTSWAEHRVAAGIVHLDLGALAQGDYELRVWRRNGVPWTATASIQAGRATEVALRSP